MKRLITCIFLGVFLTACTKSVELNSTNNDLTIQPKASSPVATPLVPAGSVQGVATIPGPQAESSLAPIQKPQQQPTQAKTAYATIVTSKGSIRLLLYGDKAPKTVTNFLQKAQSGYYVNMIFHRVEDWVIQGGDPSGDGTGGGQMPTELNDRPFKLGSLGVARRNDITVSNDSQFFICTADCSHLTGQYTNFGEVLEGMYVAKAIEKGDVIQTISFELQ
jgi:peptidyl-prolyl cis-trans isomerase B (cyclophilin B)